MLDLGMKIPKKNRKKIQKVKNLFPALFSAKTGWDGLRKGKKILVPNSVPTQLELENTKKKEKKKKIQKIKKANSGIISIQNRLREVEKERKET